MQQPGAKHEMGCSTPLAPHWLRSGSVARFTAAFLVSFTVTVFLPDSAVAAQIFPPKMLTGAPSGDFSRGQMSFATKCRNFLLFSLLHYLLVPFADTISTEPSPESLQCHLHVWLKKVMRPKIKISLVK